MKGGAVFFDRDGTINEEVGYLADLDRLVLYPEAARAIRMVNESGMKAVVVTNQSGVARGYFDEAFVTAVHRRMAELLRADGARIDGFYYCPHHPDEGLGEYRKDCFCRKPKPGMLLAAARDMNIDLERSYMVGDMMKDVETAENAGVRGILVKTGYGGGGTPSTAKPVYMASNILDAVEWIMRDDRREHTDR